MTAVADLDADMSYDELKKVYFKNCEPFESLAQCKLLRHVAARLRFLVPAEAEQGGERLTTRDVDTQSQIARRAQARFEFNGQKPVHIIPPDNLR